MTAPTKKHIPTRNSTTTGVFTFAAGSTSFEDIDWKGGDILIAYNSDTGSHQLWARSTPKGSRSVVDVGTYAGAGVTIAAGAYHVLPRFPDQKLGKLAVKVNDATVKFARLTAQADS